MGNTLGCTSNKEEIVEEQQTHAKLHNKNAPANYKNNNITCDEPTTTKTHEAKTENPEECTKEEVFEETFETKPAASKNREEGEKR